MEIDLENDGPERFVQSEKKMEGRWRVAVKGSLSGPTTVLLSEVSPEPASLMDVEYFGLPEQDRSEQSRGLVAAVGEEAGQNP